MLKRIISAFIMIISMVSLFSGCGRSEIKETTNSIMTATVAYAKNDCIDEEQSLFVNIDSSEAKKGFITVKYMVNKIEGIRIYVLYNYDKCTGYNIKDTTKDTRISLTNGNGTYYIEVVQNDGKTETLLASKTIEVIFENEFTPFMCSNYSVNWEDTMNVVLDAKEETKNSKSYKESIEIIKNFVITSLEYSVEEGKDYSKWSYFSDIDEVYNEKKGVCVDFATMFTAICRSQNIPCKLVTGYAGTTDEFHVWSEVYDGEQWKVIDLTLEDAKTIYSADMVITPAYYETVTVD